MIHVSETEARWTLTLSRPDKANALTREMLVDLDAAVQRATEAGAPTLVITGEGRVFSAGMDLEAAKSGLAKDGIWEQLSNRIAAFPGLSIAALNGTAAGGCLGMVLACDLRVMAPEAKIFYPVMKMGFLPQPSDPGRLRALVGPGRAAQILLAAQKIDAQTALDWGFADRLTSSEDLAAVLDDLTEAAVAAKPEIRAGIKALLR